MINPFIGLSTVLHLLIICCYQTISFLFPNHSKSGLRKYVLPNIFSVLIILLVLSFVSWSGETIMYASVVDEGSSYQMIQQHIYPHMDDFVSTIELSLSQHEMHATAALVIIATLLLVLLISHNNGLSEFFESMRGPARLRVRRSIASDTKAPIR